MDLAMNQENLSGAAKASPFESNFLDLLRLAAEQNASDLHLDPMDGAVRVRIRVDGTLRVIQWIKGPAYASRFFQQAKKVCGFDMGRVNVAQSSNALNVIGIDLGKQRQAVAVHLSP